jgi:hypothetical protein
MATKKPKDVNLRLLPPQLKVLVQVMGLQPALRLVEVKGGTRLIVPVRCTPEHWLNEVVGCEAFGRLVGNSAGIVMDLPKYDSVLRQWRHQQVHELSRYLTDGEVALRTGYTRRQVINIRQAEAEAACMQWDMFDTSRAPPKARLPVDEAEATETGPTAHNPFGLGRAVGAEGL